MSVVGVQRVFLRNLHTKITNSLIIGIIIAKQPHKIFSDKKNGGERGVLNFTLRDSETDYINVTCWGSAEYVIFLSKSFTVGCVVDVINPKIDIRQIEDIGEQYRPNVTSPFNLTMNEKTSHVIIHAGDNYTDYFRLSHIPTKPLAGCLTLADIQTNGVRLRGELVDILVIVKFVKPIRKVRIKKDGQEKEVTDVVITDKSCTETLITVWEQDLIERVKHWKNCDTTLFLADVRVDWSEFHKNVIIALTSRTIVTEDPAIFAANELRDYAKGAPETYAECLDKISAKIPTNMIIKNNIMSCQHILNNAEVESNPSTQNNHFIAIIYAFVMQLDLDGLTKITSTKCGKCNSMIYEKEGQCMNQQCPVALGMEPAIFNKYFDISVKLADHTGTLENCRLSGQTAEKVLGVTIDQFEMMTFEEKETLKWRFLLERCAIHAIVFKTNKIYEPFVSISSMRVADTEEINHNLPFY